MHSILLLTRQQIAMRCLTWFSSDAVEIQVPFMLTAGSPGPALPTCSVATRGHRDQTARVPLATWLSLLSQFPSRLLRGVSTRGCAKAQRSLGDLAVSWWPPRGTARFLNQIPERFSLATFRNLEDISVPPLRSVSAGSRDGRLSPREPETVFGGGPGGLALGEALTL